jgi:hypothetical protein
MNPPQRSIAPEQIKKQTNLSLMGEGMEAMEMEGKDQQVGDLGLGFQSGEAQPSGVASMAN